mmetsp:Transcript_8526/g.20070  ORF Transcript_8526/g.20070 Transcript_8526/m.20070 type:complete len:290 (-) Transcript_8526:309-1178(-)
MAVSFDAWKGICCHPTREHGTMSIRPPHSQDLMLSSNCSLSASEELKSACTRCKCSNHFFLTKKMPGAAGLTKAWELSSMESPGLPLVRSKLHSYLQYPCAAFLYFRQSSGGMMSTAGTTTLLGCFARCVKRGCSQSRFTRLEADKTATAGATAAFTPMSFAEAVPRASRWLTDFTRTLSEIAISSFSRGLLPRATNIISRSSQPGVNCCTDSSRSRTLSNGSSSHGTTIETVRLDMSALLYAISRQPLGRTSGGYGNIAGSLRFFPTSVKAMQVEPRQVQSPLHQAAP